MKVSKARRLDGRLLSADSTLLSISDGRDASRSSSEFGRRHRLPHVDDFPLTRRLGTDRV